VQALIPWPPAYKIKKHRLARSVKLRTSIKHGLEITTPFRFNIKNIPRILEENKDWIIKQLLSKTSSIDDALPTHITFLAMNETWTIHYMACNAKLELIEKPQKELTFVGKIDNKSLCKQRLLRWVKKQSAHYLSTQLLAISQQTQLNFSKLTLRDQQTRWGSCTSDKAISLNYKLIFLPQELATYVIIHELCHTQFLDHSERFWALVERFDPDWKTHRQRLRKAELFIPGWLIAS
jgi:predicted metal-dependent hydrolase